MNINTLYNPSENINIKKTKTGTFCKLHRIEISTIYRLPSSKIHSVLLVLTALHSYDYLFNRAISYKMIQKKAHLSTATISQALKILEYEGLIKIKKSWSKSSSYFFQWKTERAKHHDIVFIPIALLNQITTGRILNQKECFATLILFLFLRKKCKNIVPKKSINFKELGLELKCDARTAKKAFNFLIAFKWLEYKEDSRGYKIKKYELWESYIIVIEQPESQRTIKEVKGFLPDPYI